MLAFLLVKWPPHYSTLTILAMPPLLHNLSERAEVIAALPTPGLVLINDIGEDEFSFTDFQRRVACIFSGDKQCPFALKDFSPGALATVIDADFDREIQATNYCGVRFENEDPIGMERIREETAKLPPFKSFRRLDLTDIAPVIDSIHAGSLTFETACKACQVLTYDDYLAARVMAEGSRRIQAVQKTPVRHGVPHEIWKLAEELDRRADEAGATDLVGSGVFAYLQDPETEAVLQAIKRRREIITG